MASKRCLPSLAPFYAERSRFTCSPIREKGKFVLYVVFNAYRVEENPALDVAKKIAISLELPLLVHCFFDDASRFATARRATFLIDACRELQANLKAQRIKCTFQLIHEKKRAPIHMTLAHRAACVVMDEPFVEPHLHFSAKLAECGVKAVFVDSCCVFPARMVPKQACRRAYLYRSLTSKGRRERMECGYPQMEDLPHHLCVGNLCDAAFRDLPDQLLDLSRRDTLSLVRSTKVDRSVEPVLHTIGGSSAATLRWKSFLKRIARYAAKRNDPLADGVSRMSAYLNIGCISPFRMHRNVVQALSDSAKKRGAEKFLDEFCVWRELAYALIWNHPSYLDLQSILPKWAFQTLAKHAGDPRQHFELEALERGKTHVPLWNIAQMSLWTRGELHNNLRMTWGKEVIRWVGNPQELYDTLIHLNDKFALDGLSPPSYAGILWCLGWADGPKQERSVYGKIRFRSASFLSKRYNLDALKAFATRKHAGGDVLQLFYRQEQSRKRARIEA